MEEHKKWWWLGLLILLIIWLLISCNKKTDQSLEPNNSLTNTNNSLFTQSAVKLLTFSLTEITKTYTGSKNSLGQLIPELHPRVIKYGIRNDGRVQMAEISTSKYECDYRLGGQAESCGMKAYYRVKAMNLSSTEQVKLEELVVVTKDSKWNDIECNQFVSNRDDIQIEFYQQNKVSNQVKICFVSTNHVNEYVLPDVPLVLDTLVHQLIAIKQSGDELPWFKGEVKDPFSVNWWHQK